MDKKQHIKNNGSTILVRAIGSTTPLKLQLRLLDKTSHEGTDMMSFKFSRSDDQQANYLNYKAGQYAVVDLGTKEDPEGPVRSFTIASSPTEEFILISTRIRDTQFKKKLANLEIGSLVKFTAPLGKFVLPEDNNSKKVVFLSGGIGVTPFRSMVKYATDKQSPIKIMMFDSNRNKENILYKTVFDECMSVNKNLEIVQTITGEGQKVSSSSTVNYDWKRESGYINKVMLTKYMTIEELDNSIFYICGPPGMLKAMQKLLQEELEIPKERIKVEEFTGY
jgi:ferredoxin-NADP reductase